MLLGAHPRQIPEGPESFCPLTLGYRPELVWLLPCAQRHTEAFWLLNETPRLLAGVLLGNECSFGSGQQVFFAARPASALTCKILRLFSQAKNWSKRLLHNLFPGV